MAASSLVIGALVPIWVNISLRVIGLITGFGVGVMISAVSFDPVEEAADKSSGHGAVAWGLFVGCGVFFGGDWLISRLGGGDRKDATGDQSGSALAHRARQRSGRYSGLDGDRSDDLPRGGIGAAHLAPVFISNLPEAISSTTGLVSSGWKKSRILLMWIAIALVSGLASLAGYGLFQDAPPTTVAFVLTFAAGAILTMLADTMMPEAFEHGGKLVRVVTTLGFATAYAIHTLGLTPRVDAVYSR